MVGWAYDRAGWVGRAEQRAGRVQGRPLRAVSLLEAMATPTRNAEWHRLAEERRKSSGRGTWSLEPPRPTSGSETTRRHAHPLASSLLHLPHFLPPPGISLFLSNLLTSSRVLSYLPFLVILPLLPLLPSFSLPQFFRFYLFSPNLLFLPIPSHFSLSFSSSSSPHLPFHPLPLECSPLTPRPIRNTKCVCFGP